MSRISKIRRSCVAILIGAQILAPLQALADISQLPPMVKPNVPPNIMFTLDDSGSMLFEYMPDNLVPGVGYLVGFPAPVGVYKGSSSVVSNAAVMGFGTNTGSDTMVLKVARFRSPDVNQIYYDPATKYEPWKNADGTSMAQASPTAAYFNPVAPSDGSLVSTINLTSDTQTGIGNRNWLNASDNNTTSTSRNFYPATYFRYIGGSGCGSATTATSVSCFSRVEIRAANAPFAKLSSERTECANTGCTYEQEIQNFANWFQYWRSRLLMARGGVGTAFSRQASNLRVGFAAINAASTTINGVNTEIVVRGVSNDFAGANRTGFFNQLYQYPVYDRGTPLRYAMDKVGKYFQRTDTGGPWQNTINSGTTSDQASCRQNYHILMTDGTWNGSGASGGPELNVDGTNGSTMTAADGRTYRYTTTASYYTDAGGTNPRTVNERQYADSNANTLADVAMYYWLNDLRPLWLTPKKNVPTNAADPAFWQHLVTYTVGLGVVGTLNPETDLPALKAGTRSWSTPASDSINNVDDLWHAAVNGHGQYFSAQSPRQFADGLTTALQDISSRVGSAAAVATSNNTLGQNVKLYTSSYRTDNWSGKLEQKAIDQYTGAVSSANDWDTDNWTVDASTRNVFTYNSTTSTGIAFNYSSLPSADQTVFNNAVASFSPVTVTGADIVDYLRGNRSKEGNPFRIRNYMLGDLVNSDPQFVKEGKDGGYVFLPSASVGKGSYQSFLNWKKDPNRAATVYVGANDGMLHAFNASTTDPAAREYFAYVPKTIIPNLPSLATKNYAHRFYVDATPNIADAAIGSDANNPWRMILVSGTGAGGKAVFALDVTDPATFNASNVLWEINSSTNGYADLGYTIGVPQIGRLRDGRWVAIFGNGYGSSSGRAILYVADLTNGNLLMSIDTATSANGLSTPKLYLDTDSTIKAAYAGDINGNMWKFNFNTVPGQSTTIAAAFGSGVPLFTATNAPNGSGPRQPITTQPQIYPHPEHGVMVVFGTGKIYEDTDPSNIEVQSLYGIWDKANSPSVVSKTTLAQQVLSKSGSIYSIPSPVAVNWTNQRGWYITLNATSSERLVTDPSIFEDQVLFTTLVPGSSTDPCTTDGLSTTLQLSPLNGGPLSYKTIDTNGDGTITSTDTMASGKQSAATMGTTVIRTGNRNLKIYQAASRDNVINASPSRASDPIPTVRLWRQISGPQN